MVELYDVYESPEAETEEINMSSQISFPQIIIRGEISLNQHSYMWWLYEDIREKKEINKEEM